MNMIQTNRRNNKTSRWFCIFYIAAILGITFAMGCGKKNSNSPPEVVPTKGSSNSSVTAPVAVSVNPTPAGRTISQPIPSGPPPDPINLTEIRTAFASASSDLKIYLSETVEEIRGASYQSAIERLQKMYKFPKVNDAQRRAIQDTIPKIQALASAGGK